MLHTILIFIIIPIFTLFGFTKIHPQFGRPGRSEKVKKSPHFKVKKDQFFNLIPTKTFLDKRNFFWTLKKFYFDKKWKKRPKAPLPTQKLNHQPQAEKLKVTWLGHSTILVQLGDVSILTDPVLMGGVGPRPLIIKPFPYTHKTTIEDLDKIDVVVISHDHYDHLDHPTIMKLKKKVGHFLVPLGVAGHLERWHIPKSKITELDWWESTEINKVKFTATPSRHFSGRMIKQDETLWASWVMEIKDKKVFFTGDTGYFETFKEIGKKHGPFDLAMVECGAYNEHWANIHLMPEQSAQVAVDVKAKAIMPIHWGKFDLSLHAWDEPVKRLKTAVKKTKLRLITPKIGETFEVEEKREFFEWWKG